MSSNAINLSAQGVTYFNGNGVFSGLDGITSGFVLTSAGSGVAPSFSALGTNSGLANHGVLLAQGNSPFVSTVLGAGQVLIGTTASNPVAAFLTPGNGISILSASGSITISLSGVIPVTGGGTGSSSFITNSLIYFNGTSLTSLPPCSSTGQVLVCEGPGNPPSFVSITGIGNISVTSNGGTITIGLTGVIPVTGGGTGGNTFITNSLITFNGTQLTSLPACSTPGQILVCEGPGSPPSFVSITGVGGITVVSNGTTITVSGPGLSGEFETDDGNDAFPSNGIINILGATGGNIFTSAQPNGGSNVFIQLTGVIPVTGGGTGSNTFISNTIVIFNGTSLTSLPPCSSPGQVLVCEGPGSPPSFVTITGTGGITVVSTGTTITVSGFSLASDFHTQDGLDAFPSNGIINILGATGGNIFTSAQPNGGSNVFIQLTGVIPVTGGGTGSNTFISNTIVIFNGTSLTSLPPCSLPGQVLVCEGPGNPPSFVTMTGGGGITVISNGTTITITGSALAGEFETDDGNDAFPSNGVINILGATGGNIFTSSVPNGGSNVFIQLTGVIPVTGGGTGGNTFISNTLITFNGTQLTSLPVCSLPGQVLVCEGPGTPPSFVSLTGTGGITVISNGSTITVSGPGVAGDFHTQDGSNAFPSNGIINILGATGGNIFTSSVPNGGSNVFIALTGVIPVTGGGTGGNTFISNSLITFNGTSLTSIGSCSTPGLVLVCEGPGSPPSFVPVTGSGAVVVTANGSGISIFAPGGQPAVGAQLFFTDCGTDAIPALTTGIINIFGATGGNIFTCAIPEDGDTIYIQLTGVIPVTGGGTGSNTFISNTIVFFNGTSLTSLPPCSSTGQVLVCEGPGNPPSFVTITGVGGVSVTSNGGTITISIPGIIPITGGGTGTNTFITNTLVFFNGTSLTSLTPCSATGQVLVCEGPGNPPSFVTITGINNISVTSNGGTITIGLTGVIPVTGGGTGSNTFISNTIVIFNGTSLTSLTPCSATGQVLVCEGPGNPPSWVSITGVGGISVTSNGSTITIFPGGSIATIYNGNTGSATPSGGVLQITGASPSVLNTTAFSNTVSIGLGVVPFANGGTNATSYASQWGVIFVTNMSSFASTPSAGTAGQVLISAGGAPGPAFGSITSTGGSVIVSASATSIDLEVAGGGVPWTDVTGISQTMAPDNGYYADNASQVQLTLPAAIPKGTVVRVAGFGSGGWIIKQNGGQQIFLCNSQTTLGATGSLASNTRYDAVELLCTVANSSFVVISCVGNLSVT